MLEAFGMSRKRDLLRMLNHQHIMNEHRARLSCVRPEILTKCRFYRSLLQHLQTPFQCTLQPLLASFDTQDLEVYSSSHKLVRAKVGA